MLGKKDRNKDTATNPRKEIQRLAEWGHCTVTIHVYSFSTELIIFLTKWPQKSADGRFTLNNFRRELLRKISGVTQSKRTRLKCETRSVVSRGIPSIFLPIFIAGLKWDPLLDPASDFKKCLCPGAIYTHVALFKFVKKLLLLRARHWRV